MREAQHILEQNSRAIADGFAAIDQNRRAIADAFAVLPSLALLELGRPSRPSSAPSPNDVPGWVIEGDAALSMAWPEETA